MDKAAIILFVSNVNESNFSEEIISNLKEKERANQKLHSVHLQHPSIKHCSWMLVWVDQLNALI